LTARDVAQAVLIAAVQQQRVVTAAGSLDDKSRRQVRDLLTRAGKQAGLNYWDAACDLADEKAR
jgi:hypothetical protein